MTDIPIFVTILHVALCLFLIFVILLQPGKDAGMGAALGGGAATSAFGGRGAVTFLGKVTAACAVGFFITALYLSFVSLKPSIAAGPDESGTPQSAAVPAAAGTDGGAAATSPGEQAATPPSQGTETPAEPAKPNNEQPAAPAGSTTPEQK